MTPNMNSQPVQSKKAPTTNPASPLSRDATVLWKAWVNMARASPPAGRYSDEPAAVQTRQGQTDAGEGGIERVLPADQEDTDKGQGKQAAPAAFWKP